MAQKLNGNAPKGQLNSIRIAGSWLKMGIQPVPLQKSSKRPKSEKGWNKLLVTKETIPQFFQNGDNVGGLWGEPSGWIIDVDLDWDEASRAAPRLLPETFVYGRRKRPGSHYLYQVNGVHGSKRYDSGGGDKQLRTVITEIRATGSQSVLPPSRHPDGDLYEINHDVEIMAMTPRRLEQLVNHLTAAALIARYYPEKHGRHDFMHAVTGALLWDGWTADRVRNFALAVLDAADWKEDDRPQRERTIENTIEHFGTGSRIAGWKSMSQFMHGEDIRLCKEWLRGAGGIDVVEPGFSPKKQEKKYEEQVKGLTQVPGMVGEIAKWSGQRSFVQQPMFDVAVGLMCVALASMNRYVIEHWDTPLQPYFMLLAPSASGKESAMDSVVIFSRKLGISEHVFQGFQSYHAMLDKLATPPNVSVWLFDEAARKLRNAARSSGGPDHQIITWLLQLYGKANSFSPALPGRKNSIQSIDNPFFVTMAASQPAQMLEAITDSDLAQGFINRFILFDGGERFPEDNLQRSNLFPSKFETFFKTIRSVPASESKEDPFQRVHLENTHVWNLFRDFNSESREQAFQSDGTAVWGRANQNALIVAGLAAVGVNPKLPRITEPIAEWAINLNRWSIDQWKKRSEQSTSRTIVEHRSKQVEAYIKTGSAFMHRVKDERHRRLIKDGFMPRSVLIRLCRHLSARELDDVLQTLMLGDIVGMTERENCEVYWCKD